MELVVKANKFQALQKPKTTTTTTQITDYFTLSYSDSKL